MTKFCNLNPSITVVHMIYFDEWSSMCTFPVTTADRFFGFHPFSTKYGTPSGTRANVFTRCNMIYAITRRIPSNRNFSSPPIVLGPSRHCCCCGTTRLNMDNVQRGVYTRRKVRISSCRHGTTFIRDLRHIFYQKRGFPIELISVLFQRNLLPE